MRNLSIIEMVSSNLLFILGGMGSDVIQLALSCVILTILCTLLLVNRRMRKENSRGQGSLTLSLVIKNRYFQCKFRLITPVVLLDTGVTTTDLVGSTFFQVGFDFEEDKYIADPGYLLAYVILRVVRGVMPSHIYSRPQSIHF
ncbi:hypothetical protein COOONC_20696 [Cooperia oncophora]